MAKKTHENCRYFFIGTREIAKRIFNGLTESPDTIYHEEKA